MYSKNKEYSNRDILPILYTIHMKNYGELALELHKKYHGKVAISSKTPINTKDDLSTVYTPGVGQVCLEIQKNPSLAREYTLKRNMVAVISDGTAVLGLGNLGALAAIPVMEGKAILFKELADVDAFPICVDTQDTEEFIRTVKNIAPVFGGINLEDIAAPRCFEIERRLADMLDIPVVHDDQKGTAVVVLAGLINALKVTGKKKEEVKIIINGAGAAGISVARLLMSYGFAHVVVCDSQGAIHAGRENLNEEKIELAAMTNKEQEQGTLEHVIVGKDIFIGLSKGNLLTAAHVKTMNTDPIIFALANPTPEIFPETAKEGGAAIIATGRSDFPNQVNNALSFPGLFRGALDHGIRVITDVQFMKAAEAIAGCVTNPHTDMILPDVLDKTVARKVADALA